MYQEIKRFNFNFLVKETKINCVAIVIRNKNFYFFLPSVCNSSAPAGEKNIVDDKNTNNHDVICNFIFERLLGARFDSFDFLRRSIIVSKKSTKFSPNTIPITVLQYLKSSDFSFDNSFRYNYINIYFHQK